ncbi:MAG: hypothetical protein U0893_06160 [Chloroflexota bacterium]
MSILDPEAAQLLRRAIQLGDPGRTSIVDLRRAIEHPVPFELPPSRLRGDAPLAKVLRRAMAVAEARGAKVVGRSDLIEALMEAEAEAAGLDLDRLRFYRWCVQRSAGDTPLAGRQIGSARAVPGESERA